jgi:hypothetical protein
MTLRTFTIELRTDHNDSAKDEIILEAAKAAAKHMFTTATLIMDQRKPQIALQTGDMFVAQEEINLAEDIGS